MLSSSTATQRAVFRSRWLLLALLVTSVCINYVDRGNLSIAAATLDSRRELGLDNQDLGVLFAAFFCTYSTFQVFTGWLIDRFNVYCVYTAGFVLSSVATVPAGFVGGLASLLALRLLLGLGEAVVYPAYSNKMIFASFHEQERGFANALIDAGSRTGPAIGALGGGLIVSRRGWRMLFLTVGTAGALWLLPWCWYLVRRSAPVQGRAVRGGSGPGFAAILRQRQTWGMFLGLFCLNYTWTFILNWLPTYLTQERHDSTRMMAWYGSVPFWGVVVTTVACGWIADRWIERGASPTRFRLGFVVGGMLVNVLMLPAYLISNQLISMVLLTIACLALGLTSSNFWAITQTLAGGDACGRWAGLQNGVGNLAGIFGQYLTGVIVARMGSFFLAFAAATGMAAAGALSYWLIERRVEPVRWVRSGAI
jgi:MFS family permease